MTSPTNEQQRVDVLAVMDRWVADSKLREFTDCTIGAKDATREATAARAAVAELIESMRALIRAGKKMRDTVVETHGVAGMDGHDVALRAAEAALANVGAQK